MQRRSVAVFDWDTRSGEVVMLRRSTLARGLTIPKPLLLRADEVIR